MKPSTLAAGALACALCFAAGAAFSADAPRVRVFDATELTLDRYTVVKRIWTQTWHASFWVSTHDERADAIAALTSKAADAEADGVINLHCLNDTGWFGGYFCYGLAIKLK
ncbi:MAG TPA: hypothetical protein VGA25_01060 [Burkholderiales bacterium]|jgi:uncharacterized protein YbjQ (UPF0145 family)